MNQNKKNRYVPLLMAHTHFQLVGDIKSETSLIEDRRCISNLLVLQYF